MESRKRVLISLFAGQEQSYRMQRLDLWTRGEQGESVIAKLRVGVTYTHDHV